MDLQFVCAQLAAQAIELAEKRATGHVGKFPALSPWLDDLKQEATLTYFRVSESFDPGKGDFEHYVNKCISNDFFKLNKRLLNMPARISQQREGIRVFNDEALKDEIDPESRNNQSIHIKAIRDWVSSLEGLPQQICSQILQGETQQVIAQRLGVSQATISRTLCKCRSSLANAI